IGSVALMLDMSFGLEEEAKAVWTAMQSVFEAGFSTSDLSKPGQGIEILSTTEFADKVMAKLEELL
ncbi:isocitrate/isopropylmalate family dehydrogenase, partial [Oleiphilus sp. HI0117]